MAACPGRPLYEAYFLLQYKHTKFEPTFTTTLFSPCCEYKAKGPSQHPYKDVRLHQKLAESTRVFAYNVPKPFLETCVEQNPVLFTQP